MKDVVCLLPDKFKDRPNHQWRPYADMERLWLKSVSGQYIITCFVRFIKYPDPCVLNKKEMQNGRL